MSHICDRFSVFNFFSFLLCVLPRLNELFFFAGRSEKREARSEKEGRKKERKRDEKEIGKTDPSQEDIILALKSCRLMKYIINDFVGQLNSILGFTFRSFSCLLSLSFSLVPCPLIILSLLLSVSVFFWLGRQSRESHAHETNLSSFPVPRLILLLL
jgi:hypothetical protein